MRSIPPRWSVLRSAGLARTLALGLLLFAQTLAAGTSILPDSAQLVGTVHDTRAAWNPFNQANDLRRLADGTYAVDLTLRANGGRNHDGIYAIRFNTNHELRQVFKRGHAAGTLVTGPGASFAGNIVFRVPTDGVYRVSFDPAAAHYRITPPVVEQERIDSMQVNGFVHDGEGLVEAYDGRRTRPAELWDEWVPDHELTRGPDGSWSIDLPLSVRGGHEKNGVYQFLLSANHNADWGFGGIIGQPGRLAGGNGYSSRVGHIEETAIVWHVSRTGTYRLTAWPEDYRFTVNPPVASFQSLAFQVNGDVVSNPWNPASPDHDMTPNPDGTWHKVLHLSKDGGTGRRGLYTMNFSIDGDWALDSIGFGGTWGKTWHSDPQEWNLLFRVPADGAYQVSLDPARGTFRIDPPVEAVTQVESLQICGDFESFSADGQGGWNPLDPIHDMQAGVNGNFTKDLRLNAGRTYTYKFSANWSAWGWSLADYPYDGERRLAPHGSPPPLRFKSPRDGIFRFTANTESGKYSVVLLKHL